MGIQIEQEYLDRYKQRYASMTLEELEAELAYLDQKRFEFQTSVIEYQNHLEVRESGEFMQVHYSAELLQAKIRRKKAALRVSLILSELYQNHVQDVMHSYMKLCRSVPLEELQNRLDQIVKELNEIGEIIRERQERKTVDPFFAVQKGGSIHWRRRTLNAYKGVLQSLLADPEKTELKKEISQLKSQLNQANQRIAVLEASDNIEQLEFHKKRWDKAREKMLREAKKTKQKHEGYVLADDLAYYFAKYLLDCAPANKLNDCLELAIARVQEREVGRNYLQDEETAKLFHGRLSAIKQIIQGKIEMNAAEQKLKIPVL